MATCAVSVSVRSWSLPALMEPSSVSRVCLMRRLSMASTSASVISRRSFTSMFLISPCTWRRMESRGLSFAFIAALISSFSSSYFIGPRFRLGCRHMMRVYAIRLSRCLKVPKPSASEPPPVFALGACRLIAMLQGLISYGKESEYFFRYCTEMQAFLLFGGERGSGIAENPWFCCENVSENPFGGVLVPITVQYQEIFAILLP